MSLRHRHCGRQRQEGRGLQGQIPEAGPVQPGTDQRHVAGPDTDWRKVRASRDLPDPAVRAGDGSDGVPHLSNCGDPGSQRWLAATTEPNVFCLQMKYYIHYIAQEVSANTHTHTHTEMSVYPGISSSIDLSILPRLLISQWHWGHRLKPRQISDKYSWNQLHIQVNSSNSFQFRSIVPLLLWILWWNIENRVILDINNLFFFQFVCQLSRGPP